MRYNIFIEPEAKEDLRVIYIFIKENGSETVAKDFLLQLKKQINSLSHMPQRCRKSLYHEDEKTKDLIYKGYTISFHILNDTVHIVAVFRQRNY
jgi:plasmid stabilization system protein ParE